MAEKSILGIDIRVCSVKVVELKKGSSGWKVLNWGMEEIPYDLADKHPDKEINQAKVLKQILAANSFSSKEAIVVVGGNDVISKPVSMPRLSPEEMNEAVKWKIKDDISYHVEDAIVDFVALGKISPSGESDYLVSSASRFTIENVLQVIKDAGLQINSIITMPFALKALCLEYLSPDSVIPIVYFGRSSINISFFKGERLVLNREIPVGGGDNTKAMTAGLAFSEGRLELSFEEAEKIKREHGIPLDLETYPKLDKIPVAQLQAVVRPALEKIEDEFLRTIEYFKSQEGEILIQKILIMGGGSKTPNVLEFLSQRLGIPFERIENLSGLELAPGLTDKESFKFALPQLTAAIGAAMVFSSRTVNLLPLEIKDRKKILLKKYFKPVPIVSIIVIVLSLIYGLVYYLAYDAKRALESVDLKIAELKPRVARLEEVEKVMREEQGRRGIFKTIEFSRIEIPRVLEEISYNIPPSIMMESISFIEAKKEIRLSGISFDKGASSENVLSNFVLSLSNSPSFKKVELVNAVKNADFIYEALNFEISGVVGKRE